MSVSYSLSLGLLNAEHKPSVKKKRFTGVDFEFYRSGRIEKILTACISNTNYRYIRTYSINQTSTFQHKITKKYLLTQFIP